MAIHFGTGDLKYELVEGWERIPSGWTHPDVVAVSTDADENVFLFCRGDHPVIIYDRSGAFLDSWGEGRFTLRTHGMCMGQSEVFLVDERAQHVGRYTLDGTHISNIGPSGIACENGYDGSDFLTVQYGGAPYNRPTDISVAPSGDLYVSDGYGNSRVHRFTSGGDLVQSWGEPGSGPGQMHIPHSVWVHTDGRVFVADRENDRIQIFSGEGEYLNEWLDVRKPQDIFIDPDGLVYVAELGRRKGQGSVRRGVTPIDEPSRISIYDLKGNVLLRWGDLEGTKSGHFIAPHGLWVDSEGSIYFAEVTYTVAVKNGLVPPDSHTFQKFARV